MGRQRRKPLHNPLVTRYAAAPGQTINVNTINTPTICAQADTASATMARNAVEMKRMRHAFWLPPVRAAGSRRSTAA